MRNFNVNETEKEIILLVLMELINYFITERDLWLTSPAP